MPSLQESTGSGKAAKFIAANPLGPMADPFQNLNDEQRDYQKALSENVSQRLEKAMEEIKHKHATGTNEVDDTDRAPTGDTYRAQQAQVEWNRRKQHMETEQQRAQEIQRLTSLQREAKRLFSKDNQSDDRADNDSDSESNGSDDYDQLLEEEDPELKSIRERRIREMQEVQAKHARDMALGHGQYRTISQEDFLSECAGSSEYVAIHFFHSDFERCKILDHHLKLITPLHTRCKFLRIDAEKAPFFVAKLQIQTLPTLIVFRDGKVVNRLTGFEGLAPDSSEPDTWHTGRLEQWLATTGAIDYIIPTDEIREEMRRLGVKPKGTVWSGVANSGFRGAAYDDDDGDE